MKQPGLLRRHPVCASVATIFLVTGPMIGRVLNGVGYAETLISLLGTWYLVFTHPAFPIVVVLSACLFLNWPEIKTRILPAPFSVRPWCVSIGWYAHDPKLAQKKFTAFLGVTNTSRRRLEKCSVRLMDAAPLRFGSVMDAYQAGPNLSADRGESIDLTWAAKEPASADRRFLDIPPDGAERIAEILTLNIAESCADFAAANPKDLADKLDRIKFGWWKLRIKISAEDGTHVDTEWLATCGEQPGPIIIREWAKNGDEILQLQREGKIDRW